MPESCIMKPPAVVTKVQAEGFGRLNQFTVLRPATKPIINFLRYTFAKAVVVLLSVNMLISCYEEDMTVKVVGVIPPTFNLSGSGRFVFFSVTEINPENQNRVPFERDSGKDKVLWQIAPTSLTPEQRVIRKLPPITYGVVPEGWTQRIPQQGTPPTLLRGSVYQAGGPTTDANGGFVWFKVQDGKPVTLNVQ